MQTHLYYIDLFCGAGGTTTGVHLARSGLGERIATVIACVNHDQLAIESHQYNHPDCLHFTEDIRTLELSPILDRVALIRASDPGAIICLWASLECTHFSGAAGGRSRDEDSRTLADHLPRYVEAIQPDLIQIENVREFLSWGPLVAKEVISSDGYPCCPISWYVLAEVLDKQRGQSEWMTLRNMNSLNKLYPARQKRYKLLLKVTGRFQCAPTWIPQSRTKGRDYMRWVNQLCRQGSYRYAYRMLNAADFGAYTSRNRYFGLFARPGLPLAFPTPTHTKSVKTNGNLFASEKREPWKAVRDVLDFADQGESIFTRIDPLAPKSLERILAGLVKHVAGGNRAFLSKYYSGNSNSKNILPDGPAGTMTCTDSHALVQPAFLVKYLGNKATTGINTGCSIEGAAPTLTTQNRIYLTQCSFMSQRNGGDPKGRVFSLDGPARTMTTTDGNQQLVQTDFLVHYKGNGNSGGLLEPAATVNTRDRLALVQTAFMDEQYGRSEPRSLQEPAGVVTVNPKLNLVQVDAFLANPGWFGSNSELGVPAPTVIARGDKAPLSVVQTEFMVNYYSSGGQVESLDTPTGTVLPIPKQRLVSATPFLLANQHTNTGTNVDAPAPCMLTGNHHYLLTPSDETDGGSLPAFVRVENGNVYIQLEPDELPVIRQIKLFMAWYGIVDIRMRMLRVKEIKRIQGFPIDYYLAGSQTHQKKFLGNAVIPLVAQRWIETLYEAVAAQRSSPVMQLALVFTHKECVTVNNPLHQHCSGRLAPPVPVQWIIYSNK